MFFTYSEEEEKKEEESRRKRIIRNESVSFEIRVFKLFIGAR
jgi:hypothetical protein